MSTDDHVDCIVAGAGVVGLAIARALALQGREVIILEAEPVYGSITSSRNSEVIHAGMYYTAGSLMARACVQGKWQLYDYLKARGLPYLNCGKLIVATTDDEIAKLEEIKAKGLTNDVPDLELISRDKAVAMEPQLNCTGALWSPSTGVVDVHSFMLSLVGDAEAAGAAIAYNAPLKAARVTGNGFEVDAGGPDPMTLGASVLINSAGLHAPDLARLIEGLDAAHVPTSHYARGNYFTISGKPFSRLIYPCPAPGGLGVHVTVDIGGQTKFGPDVEPVNEINYDVDPARADVFYASIRKYWPALPDGALQPGYSGIRPRIVPAGSKPEDFLVQGPATHGISGLVNMFGIESPGLTSSLYLADHVAEIV